MIKTRKPGGLLRSLLQYNRCDVLLLRIGLSKYRWSCTIKIGACFFATLPIHLIWIRSNSSKDVHSLKLNLCRTSQEVCFPSIDKSKESISWNARTSQLYLISMISIDNGVQFHTNIVGRNDDVERFEMIEDSINQFDRYRWQGWRALARHRLGRCPRQLYSNGCNKYRLLNIVLGERMHAYCFLISCWFCNTWLSFSRSEGIDGKRRKGKITKNKRLRAKMWLDMSEGEDEDDHSTSIFCFRLFPFAI